MGPPSSGALNGWGKFWASAEHFRSPGYAGPTPDGIHIILEASRLAFADRAPILWLIAILSLFRLKA